MAETEFKYDVFISYSHKDEKWVVNTLLPALENAGLKVCIDYRDFDAGKPSVVNMEDAVDESRHTALVLTPNWTGSEWTDFEAVLTQTDDPVGRRQKMVPIMLEKCDPPKRVRSLTYVDFTRKDREGIAKKQLLRACGADDEKENISSPATEGRAVNSKESQSTVIDGQNWEFNSSAVIFDGRLRDAFPGLRGIEKFQGEEAVNRLEILLRAPLFVNLGVNQFVGGQKHPFWWFRGGSSLQINDFKRTDSNRVLMDIYDLQIDHVVAVRQFNAEERNFVYIQVAPDKPTGLYEYQQDWTENYLQSQLDVNSGYYLYEEYGVWKDKLIKREEFDDGAAMIDGKPTSTKDADLRVVSGAKGARQYINN